MERADGARPRWDKALSHLDHGPLVAGFASRIVGPKYCTSVEAQKLREELAGSATTRLSSCCVAFRSVGAFDLAAAST